MVLFVCGASAVARVDASISAKQPIVVGVGGVSTSYTCTAVQFLTALRVHWYAISTSTAPPSNSVLDLPRLIRNARIAVKLHRIFIHGVRS